MAAGAEDINAALTRVMDQDHGRLIAALIGRLGSFQLAEDCLQDALAAALEHWGRVGLPDNPRAWLLRVAGRKAIDRFRRDARFAERQGDIARLAEADTALDAAHDIPDDRLRLIFTCCHPALERKTRVALTLRLIGGLTTEEIARAFLDKPAAMGQRLSRAKRKIRDAGIPFALPGAGDMPARMASVLGVIYLIFNEGYAVTQGAVQLRTDLCDEAVYLARLMHHLCPDAPEAAGLLALILMTHARRAARVGPGDAYVPLSEQDRQLWSQDLIREGSALVTGALGQGRAGPYQIQAAIAALHGGAESHAATDWPQIVALYRLLARMEDSPVIRLNLAVAVAETEGVAKAIDLITPLEGRLSRYQPFHAARAELARRQADWSTALASYDTAIALTGVASEAAFLATRRDEVAAKLIRDRPKQP